MRAVSEGRAIILRRQQLKLPATPAAEPGQPHIRREIKVWTTRKRGSLIGTHFQERSVASRPRLRICVKSASASSICAGAAMGRDIRKGHVEGMQGDR